MSSGEPLRVNEVVDSLVNDSAHLRALLAAINEVPTIELPRYGPIPVRQHIVVPLPEERNAILRLENILYTDLRQKVSRIVTSCPFTGACLSLQEWVCEERINVQTLLLKTVPRNSHPAAAEYGAHIRRLPWVNSAGNTIHTVILCEIQLVVPMLASIFEITFP